MKQADFSRTCQGCGYAQKGQWDKKRIYYRCMAPGPWQGYAIGIGRFLPYVPAWCPLDSGAEDGKGAYVDQAAAAVGRGAGER